MTHGVGVQGLMTSSKYV